jgi:REP element-mobilizing transposase RayT
MGKVIGYMVTWTTYGTWLQGTKRGYVKDGEVHGVCARLKEANEKSQKEERFILTKENRESAEKAILDEAERLGQEILAMAISTTHVHLVVDAIGEPIETAVARYKRAATKALRAKGITGKVWTHGYDKRFCFDEEALDERVKYVERHKFLTPSGAGG